jgi:hypothetical protein
LTSPGGKLAASAGTLAIVRGRDVAVGCERTLTPNLLLPAAAVALDMVLLPADGQLDHPDGDLAAPGGDLAVPGGDLAVPGGDLAVPDGVLAVPDGGLRAVTLLFLAGNLTLVLAPARKAYCWGGLAGLLICVMEETFQQCIPSRNTYSLEK